MLNLNREYLALQKDRYLYQTKFNDKSKCVVYGRKKFLTDAGKEEFSAHVFEISKDFWTFNAGQIDFSKYPDGIWNDYISVDIIQKEEYANPYVHFGNMGDINPENLQALSEHLTKHLSDLEKRIVEDYLYIDEGVAESIELPNLPENHFWVRKNGVIVGVNLDYLKDDYEYLKHKMEEDLKELYQKTFDAIKKAIREWYEVFLQEVIKELEKQGDIVLEDLKKQGKIFLNEYIENTLKPNLNSFTDVKKTEIEEVKTQAVKDITIQENSSLQNILSKESEVITAVGNKGDEEKKELEDLGIDIKTQLELLLENADIANLQTLIGNCYKGMYSAFNTYYSGDIYYKKETAVVSFVIPDVSNPVLTKESTVTPIKKFFRLYGDTEREYNFTDNGDNKVVGFALKESNKLIRTNSTIEFELNTINYTVAINIPDTEITDLAKSMTTEQDNSAVTIIKKQTDLPLYTLDTQREPVLRKINY